MTNLNFQKHRYELPIVGSRLALHSSSWHTRPPKRWISIKARKNENEADRAHAEADRVLEAEVLEDEANDARQVEVVAEAQEVAS